MKKHQVRIVGGSYKRTLINVVKLDGLRPTPDRVRETLFNWLQHLWQGNFADKTVLDLFAGSGALGFEAASHGVATAQLVERAPAAVASLRALQTSLQAHAIKITNADAREFLKRQAPNSYDLVFIDPPFDTDLMSTIVPMLTTVLKPDAFIYLESNQNISQYNDLLTLVRQGRAGQVHYGLYQFAATQKKLDNGALNHSPESA